MSFQNFILTLSLSYVQFEECQELVHAAGIKFENIPSDVMGTELVAAYKELRQDKSHALALHELSRKSYFGAYERMSDSYSQIPKTAEVLSEKFQELFDDYQIQRLGNDLRLGGPGAKEKLKNFTLSEAKSVELETVADLSLNIYRHHQEGKENKSIVAIPSYPLLSQMIGGLGRGRLIQIIAATGYGKTNAMRNFSLAMAQAMKLIYFNMEMTFSDMMIGFAVIASGVSYADYLKGNFDAEDVATKLQNIGKNILLSSGRTLSMSQIISVARFQAKQNPLGAIVVDYDQKIDLNLRGQNEEWKALQKVSESLEELAKELNCCVIMLAQINRDGQISGSHRSQFPASTVLSFYDHEVHGPLFEAIKNRHGKKDQALLVDYSQKNSRITEREIITLSVAKKPKREIKYKPKPAAKEPWYKEEK